MTSVKGAFSAERTGSTFCADTEEMARIMKLLDVMSFLIVDDFKNEL